ncbi:D-alanyl-D-alanine carboxypeptidase/D-alanyl-D-alanine endopeptidase [Citricoccus muralis]|uniref:D-alanyl-D-alanine carboxypeptidase/D-alanyl-D-alanine-endopeptidase n=1 Tax=Citricoccus muralis TaxID=169134 RepID=A0ABY8H7X2_9MICC|nr:D-alanyl-D-alanine carboxypeptidase/D-alanyl-D-alanine-endopeptidase [Citricoccus muralis]WFP16758.1 D-alanyl-D-alanine carboxypeptidase/D-alanyl-D-alanine-endopeptidase [Citricoccus muralis]
MLARSATSARATRARGLAGTLIAALVLTGCTVLPAPEDRAAELKAAAAERAALTQVSIPATSLGGARHWLTGAQEELANVLDVATEPPSEVLALSEEAPVPSAETLQRRLNTVFAGTDFTTAALVTDTMTGEVLYSRDADAARVPASSLKILTAAAALHEMGPDHRYTTRAVLDDGTDDLVVALVAGGDALLGTGAGATSVDGRAGLGSLAQQTVDALADRLDGESDEPSDDAGAPALRIVLDDGGYSGPQLTWNDSMVSSGNISAVQPIAVHGARADSGTGTDRVDDPGAHAAAVFRAQVVRAAEEAGLDLTVASGVERDATSGLGERDGTELGAIESATVAEQVEYLLTYSDNQVAEVTARNAALASGRSGSFEGVAGLLTAAADALGVDAHGITIADGSGLSAKNRISTTQLVAIMDAVQQRPWLAETVWGLPTAGLEGTLSERMAGTAAAGTVRAKTGTLDRHSSLTGTVVTVDGRQLWFSFINTGTDSESVTEAREVQDRAATVLADCGC